MAASKSLRRLREIRRAEEQQNRAGLESAIAELQRFEEAITKARERARRARVLVARSVETGEFLDRIAGLEEIAGVDRLVKLLRRNIAAAESNVQKKRKAFLDKRIERRQVETVYEAIQAEDAKKANREVQRALDDWHRSQRIKISRVIKRPSPESDIPLTH